VSSRNASIKDDYDICNTLKKLILKERLFYLSRWTK
jgi:hypothetical protein